MILTPQQRHLLALEENARIAILEYLQAQDPNGSYVDRYAEDDPGGRLTFSDAIFQAYEVITSD